MPAPKSEPVTRFKLKKERCKGCGLCIAACPQKALRLSDGLNKRGASYVKIVGPEKCTGCGMCFLVCPDACIEIYYEDQVARSPGHPSTSLRTSQVTRSEVVDYGE